MIDIRNVNHKMPQRSRITVVETDYFPNVSENEATETVEPTFPGSENPITIAPISGDPRNSTNQNYIGMTLDQMNKWSDTEKNESSEGDYFAFFFTKHRLRPEEEQRVVIHRIISIREKHADDWTVKHPHDDNRKTLILTPPLREYSLEDWKNQGGGMKMHGTYRTFKFPTSIFN